MTSPPPASTIPTGSRARRVFARLVLVVVMLAFGAAMFEVVVFPAMLPRLPPRLYGFVPETIRPLAQSAKDGIAPERWVAVVGDSWAVGLGDWLLDAFDDWRPQFQATHLVHARTGTNFVSLAGPGVGMGQAVQTFQRMLAELRAQDLFPVTPPSHVLVYFYEGNDLNDDFRMLSRLPDPASAFRWYPPPEGVARTTPLPGLAFFGHAAAALGRTDRPFGTTALGDADAGPPGPVRARIAGQERNLPTTLQSPALELSDADVERVLTAVADGLRAARASLPGVPFTIVYLPSPLATYELVTPTVGIETYHGGQPTHPASAVGPRSDAIVAKLSALAAPLGIRVVDTRPALRAAAREARIHGPRDWQHLNRLGYEALAPVLEKALASP